MKKIRIILIIIVVLIGVVVIGAHSLSKSIAKDIVVTQAQVSLLEDGTYTGEYSSGIVSAEVVVTVINKKIASIDLLQHTNGLGSKAETIINEVIGQNTLDVDTVSGATLSSRVILKAIEQALVD